MKNILMKSAAWIVFANISIANAAPDVITLNNSTKNISIQFDHEAKPMKKELTTKSEIKLVGLTARTNNNDEMNPQTAKIGGLIGRFWGENLASQIPNRKNPGVTLSVYTEYDSNENGDYTYFYGEEVDSFENIPSSLQTLTIPAAKYQKFTTESGKMPDVVINAWQQIWKMTPSDFEGNRAYIADFEVYDQRAMDPANTSLDIYIGIKE